MRNYARSDKVNKMIFSTKPEQFNPLYEVVSCFLENNGEILLLHRQDHKSEGNHWGIPAGKVENDESLEQAMARELEQETGHHAQPGELKYFNMVYVKYPDYDFIYHTYHLPCAAPIEIKINPKEHKNFLWISPEKALKLGNELIRDLDACIKLFYNL